METLQTLGLALGLATLSGLNLYLTVLVAGVAIQQQWITLLPQYEQLHILAHPAIIAVAGVLYLLQFFADKVPWIDSLWDSVHTLIRPIGGAMLAVRVLGNPDPVYDMLIALLAGGVTLIAHSVKAGTRLVANHSPEPFSNIALSVTEDIAVIGGLALINYDPVLALTVFSILLLIVCYFVPKLYRSVKVNLWLLWRKLSFPASDRPDHELKAELPSDLHVLFHQANLLSEKITWAAPCVSSKARRIPTNLFGYLVATPEEPTKLWFLAKRRWRRIAEELDLTGYKVAHEPKFLSENLVLYSLEKKPRYTFYFDRTQTALVKTIVASIEQRLASAQPLAPRAESVSPDLEPSRQVVDQQVS
jgi:hypothetical protein